MGKEPGPIGRPRQTVYRWWSTKAEILFEASAADAEEELAVSAAGDALDDLTAYLEALVRFLAHSPAGASHRALLGEAQHDPAVAGLLASKDVLGGSARAVIARAVRPGTSPVPLDHACALLIGPVFFWVVSGRDPALLSPRELAEAFLREVGAPEPR